MTTGLELDTVNAIKSIAMNTRAIAVELITIRGILELIYKNGVPGTEKK